MPDSRNTHDDPVVAGLGAIIKQAFDAASFAEFRDLKAHLERFWGPDFVQKHSEIIMEISWKYINKPSQETLFPAHVRPPSPCPSNDPVAPPICLERYDPRDMATLHREPFNSAGRSGLETKTNRLSLQIFYRNKAQYLPCVAVQGNEEIGCIIQQDAELLGLDPAEKPHMLRWTVIESDGVPGTMRSSAFHIVPNKSIPQNVILGRDWLMKEAFVSGASVAEKPPSRPCTEVPFNVRDAQPIVSQEPAVIGQYARDGHAAFAFQMLHEGYGKLTQELTRGLNDAHTNMFRESMKGHLPPTQPNLAQQPQPYPIQYTKPSQPGAPHSWPHP